MSSRKEIAVEEVHDCTDVQIEARNLRSHVENALPRVLAEQDGIDHLPVKGQWRSIETYSHPVVNPPRDDETQDDEEQAQSSTL